MKTKISIVEWEEAEKINETVRLDSDGTIKIVTFKQEEEVNEEMEAKADLRRKYGEES